VKINMKRRMGIVENMKTNAKKMGVDWKQEDQQEKDFLHLENMKTNAKKRIVVPYSLKTQRPMWKEKDQEANTFKKKQQLWISQFKCKAFVTWSLLCDRKNMLANFW
jgi:hypothetical protein